MNKSDLAAAVAASADLSKADATKAVDAAIEAIVSALRSDTAVRLAGFGTFSTVHRPESPGRNPRTGERITVQAARLPRFKAGRRLREALN